MLDYLHRAELIDEGPDYEFRWACVAQALPDGKKWEPAVEFTTARNAWATYQRNDALNYALECLMWVALDVLEGGPQSPRDLTRMMADMALARVPAAEDLPSIPALPGRVSGMISACARSVPEAKVDPWGHSSTWRWVDRLEAADGTVDRASVCGMAVRVLARLATDRGMGGDAPFATIPDAAEMAKGREVHLERWWSRVADQRDERTGDFIAKLILEWVILRHLRVATRKLAGQGVSTYKFRPEEGELVLVAEKVPEPTFTAPRTRQAFRILTDLGYVTRSSDGWKTTVDGAEMASPRAAR